jgi:SM-20-related protein
VWLAPATPVTDKSLLDAAAMSSNEAGGAADNAAAAERRKIDATIMSFLAVSSAPPPDRRLTHFNANIKSFLGETAAESLLPAPAATGATTNSSTMSTAAVSHKTSFRQQQQQQQQQHVDHLEDQKVMSDFDRIAIMREGCSQIFIKDACFGREIANAALASAKELLGSGRLRCAGMGRGKTSWSHTTYRSDSIMWVTNGAGGVGKALDAVVRVLERRLRSDLHLPANRVSVQLAHYAPGSGGFVKHIDAWKYSRPQEEHGDITAATGKDTVENDRILTAIYYLNEGWSEGDGGCLRVHSAQLPSDAPPESDTVDVQPLADRLVMFRSDVVEHEVRRSSRPLFST